MNNKQPPQQGFYYPTSNNNMVASTNTTSTNNVSIGANNNNTSPSQLMYQHQHQMNMMPQGGGNPMMLPHHHHHPMMYSPQQHQQQQQQHSHHHLLTNNNYKLEENNYSSYQYNLMNANNTTSSSSSTTSGPNNSITGGAGAGSNYLNNFVAKQSFAYPNSQSSPNHVKTTPLLLNSNNGSSLNTSILSGLSSGSNQSTYSTQSNSTIQSNLSRSSPTHSNDSSDDSSNGLPSMLTINNKRSSTVSQSTVTPVINTQNLKKPQSRSAVTPNRYNNDNQFKRRNDQQNNRANSVNSPTQFGNMNDVVKRSHALRTQYLSYCDQYGVKPSQEVIRLIKVAVRNQEPLQKLSICHAQADDNHIKALVHALTSVQNDKNNRGGNNRKSNNSNQTLFDVNEILLNHNNISDVGANLIIKELLLPQSPYHKQIISIELFGNELTDACCELVAEMLKTNKVLKRLKLGDNKIGPEGARILGEGLKHNQTLTQLHLGGNKVDVVGIKSIAEALINNTSLTSLGLRDNGIGSDGMKYLAETLKSNTQLSDIQLKGNSIKAMGASCLSTALITNQSLKVLELQSNAIGPVGVKSLCQALKDNHSVHALNFNDNELGDEGALYVANLLKVNPSITTLGLANNRIRKKGAVALAEALKCEQTAVTGLDLGNNEIGNGGAVALSAALAVNTVLTSLDLRSCEIHLKGILALSNMAETNTSLRHLDLGANYAKNQGASSWAQVLSKNRSLTRLCLTDNQIYHEGGEALAIGLQSNYTLRNFSYGGQGPQQNKIDSSIRRIIDSIVTENKKYWEQNQTSSEVTYTSNNQMRTVDISKMRLQQQLYFSRMSNDENGQVDELAEQDNLSGSDENNSASDTLMSPSEYSAMSPMYPQSPSVDGKSYNSMPNWLLSSVHIPRSNIDPEEIDFKLEFIFKNKLLKAENPKFKGCYFIGNIVNTLKKVYPETRIDEGQLVQFAMNNPKYQVHLSREMVKTQMKYLGDQEIKTPTLNSASSSEPPTLMPIQKKSSMRMGKTPNGLTSPNDVKKSVRYEPSNLTPKMSNNTTASASNDIDISTSTGPQTPPSPTLQIKTNFQAPLNKRAYTDPGILGGLGNSTGLLSNGPSLMESGNMFSLYSPPYQSIFNPQSQTGNPSGLGRTLSPFLDSNPFGMGTFASPMNQNTLAYPPSSFSMFGQSPSHLTNTNSNANNLSNSSPYFVGNSPNKPSTPVASQSGTNLPVHERTESDETYHRYDSMVDKLLQ